MTKTTYLKAILSGNILEFYAYEKALMYDFKTNREKSLSLVDRTEEEKLEILTRSLQRTKKNLRRLINSNCLSWINESNKPHTPKFITLTFAENVQELTIANKHYTNFIKRLNYELYKRKENLLKYTVVPEFQKRGAVHFHIVFFNLSWFDSNLLRIIWKHGFVKIQDISNIKNIGSYMTKYMTKDILDKRLAKRKRYFSSRKLRKPLEILDQNKLIELFKITKDIKAEYRYEYNTEHQGLTKYKVIHLDHNLTIKNNVIDLLNNQ